jgi:hypothetical protein
MTTTLQQCHKPNFKIHPLVLQRADPKLSLFSWNGKVNNFSPKFVVARCQITVVLEINIDVK